MGTWDKPRVWVAVDLGGSEDGTETYRGTSEADARKAFADLLVAGKACRLMVTVNPTTTALRIVCGIARIHEST